MTSDNQSTAKPVDPLLPCPFCGNKAEWQESGPWHFIQCFQCGCRTIGVGLNMTDGPIVDWNRRVQITNNASSSDDVTTSKE